MAEEEQIYPDQYSVIKITRRNGVDVGTGKPFFHLKVDNLDTGYRYGRPITVRIGLDLLTLGNEPLYHSGFIEPGTSVYEVDIKNLEYSTPYYVEVNIAYPEEGSKNLRRLENDNPTTTLFNWHTPKNAREPFLVTALEWRELGDNINYVRARNGLSYYHFTTVNTGDLFTANIFNEW